MNANILPGLTACRGWRTSEALWQRGVVTVFAWLPVASLTAAGRALGQMPGQNHISAKRILYGRGRALSAQPDPGQAPHSQRRARLEKQPVCVGFV